MMHFVYMTWRGGIMINLFWYCFCLVFSEFIVYIWFVFLWFFEVAIIYGLFAYFGDFSEKKYSQNNSGYH